MVSSYCNRFYANEPDLAARRIEAIGFPRYTIERPHFSDHLEAIKFICKDFWSELFKKQIDNLKTKHRIIDFVGLHSSVDPLPENGDLSQDNPLAENKAAQATSMNQYFPCGIIRGALSNLGIPCAVTVDVSDIPACSFVVRIKA